MSHNPAAVALTDRAHAAVRDRHSSLEGFPVDLAPVPVMDNRDRLALVTVAAVDGGHTCSRSDCHAEAFRQVVVSVDADGGQWCVAACPEHFDAMLSAFGLRRSL